MITSYKHPIREFRYPLKKKGPWMLDEQFKNDGITYLSMSISIKAFAAQAHTSINQVNQKINKNIKITNYKENKQSQNLT